MRKLLIFFAYIVVFLSVDFVVAWRMTPDAHTPQEAIEKSGTKILADIVARTMKLRLSLPEKVDDLTQLEDVRAEKGRLTYVMGVNATGAQFDHIMSEITEHMGEVGCKREDYIKMLSFGLSISLSIHSADGQQAAPIIFTPQSCGVVPLWEHAFAPK